jgi:polysaccharide biosynthesis/export protein
MRIINYESYFGKPCRSLLRLSGAIFSLCLFACSTPKNITYFKDLSDTAKLRSVLQAEYYTPTIQADDILQVTIQTLDPTATALLNQNATASWPVTGGNTNNSATGGIPTGSNVPGYLVDKNGYVILPLIGKVFVKDKTTDKVRDEINYKAAEYYKDPIVNVRFANFKITVLGEVNRPSTYVMPNEKVTLLDALGMAGDLTIYGKRENVLLVRENGKTKDFIRFNLNDSRIFSSAYFYLHQGDVVYVEPNKYKVASQDISQVRKWSLITAALTLLIVIASRVNF